MVPPASKSIRSTDALVGLWTIALTSFVLAGLHFLSEILIPLALAVLLTFLLTPIVTRLERWVGRIAAVLVVVAFIFGAVGAGSYIFTRQIIDLATQLPEYKVHIQHKVRAFRSPKDGTMRRISDAMEDVKQELAADESSEPVVTETPGRPQATRASPPKPAVAAVPVKMVETSRSDPMALMKSFVAPVLGPLGTAALVLVLVVFMLLQREDLRNRLIRLIGQGRISSTTRAMDDAGKRVSRYLLMQFVVNVSYGIPLAIGLYFIGVPNAVLWGAFASVLRFIPYVGPWIAAIVPILLSLAITDTWWTPLLTIGLFILLELISNNVMEPWLYGSSTGVSPVALIVAAVFWTWLWGPIGLVMATPLTVCLVVMGRHIPRLAFFSVALSDEDALTPVEDCYHRLLTVGEQDETEFVDRYLKANSRCALYDQVLLPVIVLAETDHRLDRLEGERLDEIHESLREIVEDLGTRKFEVEKKTVKKTGDEPEPLEAPPMSFHGCRVQCLPARSTRDELAGEMLAQLLRQRGFDAKTAPAKLTSGELVALVEKADADIVCISVVAPSTVIHARYLCTKLRAAFPRLKIAVGLWNTTELVGESDRRLRESGADDLATTLENAIASIVNLAPPPPDGHLPAALPPDEEARLAALGALGLLDTPAEPFFDRITAKLVRIFDVPIALISFIDRDRQFFYAQTGLPEDLAAARELPREITICQHVVAEDAVLVVEDLARDRRFSGNPFLIERKLRFYAGVPIHAPGGQAIGSLCLLDTRPHQLTVREMRVLSEYAREVDEEIARHASKPEDSMARAPIA